MQWPGVVVRHLARSSDQKKEKPPPENRVRQHIDHLFDEDDVVRTRPHSLAERKAPNRCRPVISWVKNDKPRPRYKSDKTKDLVGPGNRVFGQMGLPTPGRSAGNHVVPERTLLPRKVSSIAQVSLETSKRDYILSAFPTIPASRVRRFDARSSTVTALGAGFDWQKGAQLIGTSVALVRDRVWREIKEVRWRLRADDLCILSKPHISGRIASARFCSGRGDNHASQ
jgi:hypothetical protein